LERLKNRGLKYRSDVVLVLVGWNDLVYSSLPSWKPGLDLSQIERAYQTAGSTRGDRPRLRDIVYGHSRLAAVVRDARNAVWNRWRIEELIRSRQVDSGTPFNEEALSLYVRNLERILQLCAEDGARMALIRWPALVTPHLADDSTVHRRLVPIYSNFPLSTGEILRWHERYSDAQQEFAARHHDVLFVDARTTFERMTRAERLDAFTDLAHLTARGNEVVAETVLEALEKAEMPSATPKARQAAAAAGETAHRQRRR
jgi:lysophospholipase L1-like esterase